MHKPEKLFRYFPVHSVDKEHEIQQRREKTVLI